MTAGLRDRIRLPRIAPAPAAPPIAVVPVLAIVGPELAEDDLEQVVGGLERAYAPGLIVGD